MKPVIPGYQYELTTHGGQPVTLQFVERVPDAAPAIIAVSADGKAKAEQKPRPLVTKIDGLTNEEVIAALMHRLIHLNQLLPHVDNFLATHHLELALTCLTNRTNERTKRGVEGTAQR